MNLHEAQGRLTRVLQPHIHQPTRTPITYDQGYVVTSDHWLMAIRQWTLDWAGGMIADTANDWSDPQHQFFGYGAWTVRRYVETPLHDATISPGPFNIEMEILCTARGPRGHGANSFSVTANRTPVFRRKHDAGVARLHRRRSRFACNDAGNSDWPAGARRRRQA